MRFIAVLAFVWLTVFPAHALAATQSPFSVTANMSPLQWLVNGQANPTLTLTRGQTYTFNVDAGGVHPFWIKTAAGAGVDACISGVSKYVRMEFCAIRRGDKLRWN